MTPSASPSLSSLQLDAFEEVARREHFSKAARELGLTQSALSQRILNLEEELGTALFLRGAAGARLTEAGAELLRYCRQRSSLETEFLGRLKPRSAKGLSGELRLAGFSTVMRSVVMPALGTLVASEPGLRLELQTREVRELARALRRGEADFVVSDREDPQAGVENVLLGHERYVAIESTRGECRRPDYLDHDSEDATTDRYFARMRKTRKSSAGARREARSHLDEIYAIIDGVALGWGRAIVPRHLLRGRKDVRVAEQGELGAAHALKSPVFLQFHAPSFPLPLYDAVIAALKRNSPSLLSN